MGTLTALSAEIVVPQRARPWSKLQSGRFTTCSRLFDNAGIVATRLFKHFASRVKGWGDDALLYEAFVPCRSARREGVMALEPFLARSRISAASPRKGSCPRHSRN